MTEAANRPQGTTAPVDERFSGRPADAGDLPVQTETYRPLSLMALAGFGVAALYTLIVVGGGAIALLARIPWLMPTWTFLIPLTGLVLCWLARRHIRDSENTLSGLAFTTWGIRLIIVVALTYAAYYSVSFLAVELQAKDCVAQFFDLIERGQTERAFLHAMGVNPRDMEDAEVRDRVQVQFNTPVGPNTSSGAYNRFSQTLFVRAIQNAGREARISSLGVTEWKYEEHSYKMKFRYHVVTPLAEFDMNVDTLGSDSKPGEPKGRQWHVVLVKGETSEIQSSLRLLPGGEEFMNQAKESQPFVLAWQNKLAREDWDEVYLDTLKPTERERQRKAWLAHRLQAVTPLAGPIPLGGDDQAYRAFLDGRKALAEGSLIRIDEKTFWTSRREREPILKLLRHTFQTEGEGKPRFFLRMSQAQLPLSRRRNGELTILFDMTLNYQDESNSKPLYVVDGVIAVTADEHQTETPGAWRIEAIEVQTGRTAPNPQRAVSPPPPEGGPEGPGPQGGGPQGRRP